MRGNKILTFLLAFGQQAETHKTVGYPGYCYKKSFQLPANFLHKIHGSFDSKKAIAANDRGIVLNPDKLL